MSWISTFMKGKKSHKRRNSMRTVEDVYDAKAITVDDYVELKSSLLNGNYSAFRDTLATILQTAQPTLLAAQLADLEALHVKAQQLAHYKEQMEQMGQNGGDDEEDEDDSEDNDEDGEDDQNDDDDEDDDEDGKADQALYQPTQQNLQQEQPTGQAGGGSRFASAWGPGYSPRYKRRSFRR
jgi:hypothetical protein